MSTSTYLGTWELQPGLTLDQLIALAAQQLPDMLTEAGARLTGQPVWRIALVMTAPAEPEPVVAPYDSCEAWIEDMLPEPGWRREWDQVAA